MRGINNSNSYEQTATSGMGSCSLPNTRIIRLATSSKLLGDQYNSCKHERSIVHVGVIPITNCETETKFHSR